MTGKKQQYHIGDDLIVIQPVAVTAAAQKKRHQIAGGAITSGYDHGTEVTFQYGKSFSGFQQIRLTDLRIENPDQRRGKATQFWCIRF